MFFLQINIPGYSLKIRNTLSVSDKVFLSGSGFLYGFGRVVNYPVSTVGFFTF